MTDKKRFLLRINQQSYDAVEKWASDEFRSVNAQIELIINQALKEAGRQKKQGHLKIKKKINYLSICDYLVKKH